MTLKSQSVLEIKRKILSKFYKGFGRPKKSDYEYKSIIDMMLEMDTLFNKRVDNLIE